MPVAPTPTRSSWSVCGTGVRPCTMIKATGEGGLELGVPGEGRGARFRKAADGSGSGLEGYYAGEPLVVVRDADGAVSHLDLASFRFTRLPYDPERDIPGGVDTAGWH